MVHDWTMWLTRFEIECQRCLVMFDRSRHVAEICQGQLIGTANDKNWRVRLTKP